MFPLPFDIYPFIRPILFSIDPEKAHSLAIAALKKGLLPKIKSKPNPLLHTQMCGLEFDHPIGLAAGFDKQAEVISQTLDLGFSYTEIGGVTPLPQSGNPKPRLFRIPESKAIINRFGLNSVGADVVHRRLVAFRDTQTRVARRIVGVNLAKNKDTKDAAADYVKGVEVFAPYADFLTLNVSSPNTPGLRDMQAHEALSELLRRVCEARAQTKYHPLIFLKIAPDISLDEARDIAGVALTFNIDALIVSNTTTSRPAYLPPKMAQQTGGLSGQPLFEMSTGLLGTLYQITRDKIPLIGCGGVFTGAQAYAKIRAGASLIQIYTALVYEGPRVVARITSELATLLKRDGFASLKEAVGMDFK